LFEGAAMVKTKGAVANPIMSKEELDIEPVGAWGDDDGFDEEGGEKEPNITSEEGKILLMKTKLLYLKI
jgi:hypothetical protein